MYKSIQPSVITGRQLAWSCYSNKLLAVPIGRLIDDVWVRVLVSHLRATWSTT